MPIELKIPEVGESITEVEIGGWLTQEGEQVKKHDAVVTIESEKATVEIPAPEAGTLTKVIKKQGESAKVGEVIGYLEKDGQPAPTTKQPAAKPEEKKDKEEPTPHQKPAESRAEQKPPPKSAGARVMPAAQRALAEHGLRAEAVEATGPGGFDCFRTQ